MKRFSLFIAVFAFAAAVNAQIILSHSFTGDWLYPGCFSTGAKYVVVQENTGPGQIQIYNLDFTLFKSITIASQIDSDHYCYVRYVSDDLFDTDSTTFEYMVFENSRQNTIGVTKIYSENGATLFSRDSSFLIFDGPTFGNSILNWVTIQNDSGVFMPFSDHRKIYLYKLPGKLHHCNCGSDLTTGMPVYNMNTGMQLSNPFPNPADHSTSISYQLPAGISSGDLVFYDLKGNEVKRFRVGNAFQNIEVSTDELPQGTYLYNLQTAGNNSSIKKMIVIR